MIDIPPKQMPDIHGHQPVFQPIVSLKEKRIIGFEALTRCVDPATGCLYPPGELFEDARKTGLDNALDRISRDQSLRAFSDAGWGEEYFLFLNVEPAILRRSSAENRRLRQKVEAMGLTPSRVAIEIEESRMESPEAASALVARRREDGFRVVLDDFGSEQSHLDRIPLLRPDILKIDRQLVQGVAEDFYRQSMVRAIVGAAERIGTLTLAVGLETDADILTCHELGIHFFQGFRFSRPAPMSALSLQACAETLSAVFEDISGQLEDRIASRVRAQRAIEETARTLCETVAGQPAGRFADLLRERMPSLCGVQCLFVLDPEGRQVGETLVVERPPVSSAHPFFTPSGDGTDHALKPYFCYPKFLGAKRYFTDPYLSLATGAVCRTLSARFEAEGGIPHMLCIDVDAQFPDHCPAPNA
jgi:EAL domain-containing protein (putative c-di-GMP-specific phosphodiesterase class I)